MFNEKIFNSKIIVTFFFFSYFIIGNVVVTDYGIALDEDYQREIGQNRLDYIKSFFLNFFSTNINIVENKISIKWPEYGSVFELPAIWLEKLIGFSETRLQFFFRHYLIFLTSFVGSISFIF